VILIQIFQYLARFLRLPISTIGYWRWSTPKWDGNPPSDYESGNGDCGTCWGKEGVLKVPAFAGNTVLIEAVSIMQNHEGLPLEPWRQQRNPRRDRKYLFCRSLLRTTMSGFDISFGCWREYQHKRQ